MTSTQSITLKLYTSSGGRLALDITDYSPVCDRPAVALDRDPLFRSAFVLQDLVATMELTDVASPTQIAMNIVVDNTNTES